MLCLKSHTAVNTNVITKYYYIGSFVVTSYNATVEQCDTEPDIGAHGRVAYNGVPTGHWFASNIFKKGTKIVIPSISGKTVWICRDRLNEKYKHRIDLLMPIGKSVGKHYTRVYIVKRG